MLQLKINIQSFSDVITNSSSEIFCTISGADSNAIYELLEPLFPEGFDCYDDEPRLRLEDDGIELWFPYTYQPKEFYKAGLETILDKYFKDNYTIKYE